MGRQFFFLRVPRLYDNCDYISRSAACIVARRAFQGWRWVQLRGPHSLSHCRYIPFVVTNYPHFSLSFEFNSCSALCLSSASFQWSNQWSPHFTTTSSLCLSLSSRMFSSLTVAASASTPFTFIPLSLFVENSPHKQTDTNMLTCVCVCVDPLIQ